MCVCVCVCVKCDICMCINLSYFMGFVSLPDNLRCYQCIDEIEYSVYSPSSHVDRVMFISFLASY